MGIIVASILTLFLNKQEKNKVLACILISYIAILNTLLYLEIAVLQDYLNIYTALTLIVLISLIVHTDKSIVKVLILFSVIVPHLYYLLILYKPYMLMENTPIWWLFSVDSILTYSVFFILYEQANDFNFKSISFKDYMLNAFIIMSLFLL